jgi:hypothetical protein
VAVTNDRDPAVRLGDMAAATREELPPIPSGDWSGYFEYDNGTRHPTRLEWKVEGGHLSGTGSDGPGAFEFSGSCAAGTVKWTKTYTRASHSIEVLGRSLDLDFGGSQVLYQGEWDGERIRGTWTYVGHEGSGAFELRPGKGHEPPKEAAQPKFKARVHFSGGEEDFSFPLHGGSMFIGTLGGLSMVGTRRPEVVQAEFFFLDGRVAVRAGTQPVLVNGADIGAAPRTLEPTDVVSIGKATCRAEME